MKDMKLKELHAVGKIAPRAPIKEDDEYNIKHKGQTQCNHCGATGIVKIGSRKEECDHCDGKGYLDEKDWKRLKKNRMKNESETVVGEAKTIKTYSIWVYGPKTPPKGKAGWDRGESGWEKAPKKKLEVEATTKEEAIAKVRKQYPKDKWAIDYNGILGSTTTESVGAMKLVPLLPTGKLNELGFHGGNPTPEDVDILSDDFESEFDAAENALDDVFEGIISGASEAEFPEVASALRQQSALLRKAIGVFRANVQKIYAAKRKKLGGK